MKTTIRRRLVAGFLCVVLAAVLLLGLVLALALRSYVVAGLVERYALVAKVVAQVVNPELQAGHGSGLAPVAAELAHHAQVRVTIIAPDGTVLADSQEDPARMENHSHRPEVARARTAGSAHSVRFSTTLGLDMLYVAVRVPDAGPLQGVARVAVPLAGVSSSLRRLTLIILACLLPGTSLAVLVSLRMAARIAGPVETMTAVAERIAAGDLEARASLRTGDELELLAGAMSRMAAALQQLIAETGTGKQRLEAVLEAMVSGVLFIDGDGRVRVCNPAAATFLGLEHREPAGKHHLELFRDCELVSAVEQALTRRELVRTEVRLAFPGPRYLEVTINPLPGANGRGGLLVLLHDISELRRLDELRSEFIANVSHELKTPVTSVQGFAETLMAVESTSGEVREFAGIIHAEAARLSRLINDLLELSRLESGAGRPNREHVDLTALARQVCGRLRPQAQAASITLDSPLPVPVYLYADARQLEQAVANLVDNAIKYGYQGGQVWVRTGTAGSEAVLTVGDNGPGIPAVDLPRVFERFYRSDKSRSQRQAGTGLGLAIVKHVAQVHGGRVAVTSRPGQTLFRVFLPLRTRGAGMD